MIQQEINERGKGKEKRDITEYPFEKRDLRKNLRKRERYERTDEEIEESEGRIDLCRWTRDVPAVGLHAFSHITHYCMVRPIVVLSAVREGRESTLCASPVPCGGDVGMSDALQVVLSSRDGTVRVSLAGRIEEDDLFARIREAQRVLAFAREGR